MPSQLIESPAGRLEVRPIEPELALSLRHRVLRPHQSIDEMGLMGSDRPGAAVIGAVSEETGEVVGTAAVAPEEPPGPLGAVVFERPAWRLRSMATTPELRGSGVGSAVLAFALEHVRTEGGLLVWCNARLPARRFYERAGFVAFGSPWEEEAIGPHIVMWRLTAEPEGDRK